MTSAALNSLRSSHRRRGGLRPRGLRFVLVSCGTRSSPADASLRSAQLRAGLEAGAHEAGFGRSGTRNTVVNGEPVTAAVSQAKAGPKAGPKRGRQPSRPKAGSCYRFTGEAAALQAAGRALTTVATAGWNERSERQPAFN